jgi:ABC-2 type transport system permease protein
MRHYARIYGTFFRSSLMRELQFRANFIAKILQNTVWFFFFLVILYVIFGKVKTVGGWNQSEASILAATLFIVNSICNLFTFSLMEIPEHVRKGTLDFVITKPVDSQFWVSARKFNFNEIGSFLAGLGLLFVSANDLSNKPNLGQYLLFFLCVGASCLILYGFQLFVMTLGIYFVRVDNLWVFVETLTGLSRNPMDIFPKTLQRIFTYGIPIAFLSYVPASQIVKGANPTGMLLAYLYASLIFFGARFWWKFSLKHYSSASS